MSDVRNVEPEHKLLATFICHRIYRRSNFFPSINKYFNPTYKKKYVKSWHKLTKILEYFKSNSIDPDDYVRVVVAKVEPEIFTPFQLLNKRAIEVWKSEVVAREDLKLFKHLSTDVAKFMANGSLKLLVNPTHELVFEYSKYFLAIIPGIEKILKRLGNDVFYEAFISDTDFLQIQKQVLNLFFKRYNVVPKQLSEMIALILTDREHV